MMVWFPEPTDFRISPLRISIVNGKIELPPVQASTRTDVWHHWLHAGIEHLAYGRGFADSAVQARDGGYDEAAGEAVASECRAGMVSAASAAFAVDGLHAAINYLMRLKLFQGSDGKFRFQYSYNADGSNAQYVRDSNGNPIVYDTVDDWSPNNGSGRTAMEVNNTTDSCGVYARNIWLMNSSYVWRAANSAHNSEMVYKENGTAQCGSVRLSGVGNIGDDIEYYRR